MLKNKVALALSCAVSLALVGCGGGSSSDPQPTPVLNTTPQNAVPSISSAQFSVNEDEPLGSNVTATDDDGDTLTFSLTSEVTNGTIELKSDGSFTYQPDTNFFGEDSFTVQVSDGIDTSSASFGITVAAVNDVPVFDPVSTITRLEQPVKFALSAEDVDGDELIFEILSQPQNGSLVINDDKTATYTPNVGAKGEDKFQISASDTNATVSANVLIDNNLAFIGNLDLSGEDLENVDVLLTADNVLERIAPNSDGSFKVYGLEDGNYAVKVRKPGYKSSVSQEINLDIDALVFDKTTSSKSKLTRGNKRLSGANISAPNLAFEMHEIDSSSFSYHWEEDKSTAGSDYAAYVNQPVEVVFSDETFAVVDDSSANNLHHDYNIILVDSSEAVNWTQEHAYRILESMKTIPQQKRDFYEEQSLPASKWILTSDYIEDDIQIDDINGVKQVTVSEAAFVNASPKVAKVEGKRGVYYSQRLHHALVRFVTDNGYNKEAYEKILTERYGVSTQVSDYAALTSETTGGEPEGRFQDFHAEEIVQLINMFEEMPKGVHKLPELKYLVRRLDGTPHPLYPDAPAVAWSWASDGYIEFMETAFNTSSVEHMHRLVIHEKAHFLWENQFDDQLKDDWIELGGWYQDINDPDGWATTTQTEFVSAYAHQKNPNEDMAESISYFIINPDKLKSRALGKYEFVRDRIMQGNIYISQIREDLTFQVYNLFPDYVFPGKIKRVDIHVEGEPEQDKTVSVEIELHALDIELEGATHGFMRVFSEIGTYVDLGLSPVLDNGTLGEQNQDLSTVLRGTFELSKHAKAGYWRTDQIVITDAVGNQRMEGANDFGWKLHINNPLEDTVAPEYVADSMVLFKSVTEMEGQEVQIIHATWDVAENVAMADSDACYASFNDELPDTYRFESEGRFNNDSQKCETEIVMPDYMPSSNYSLNYLRMTDQALNQRGTYFTDPGHGLREEQTVVDEQPQMIELVTNNPDTQHPELDLNDIQITATPTNPDAPNGETEVTVTFRVRDNISGYGIAAINLRDPQGINHHYWVYNNKEYGLYPESDPNEWQIYYRTIILPVGSAPGTWGLSEMTIYDRAKNFKGYDFTEIVHFDVVE